MVKQGLAVRLSSLLERRRSPAWDVLEDPGSVGDFHYPGAIGVHDAQVFIVHLSICNTCEQNLLSVGGEPWFHSASVSGALI